MSAWGLGVPAVAQFSAKTQYLFSTTFLHCTSRGLSVIACRVTSSNCYEEMHMVIFASAGHSLSLPAALALVAIS